MKEVDAWCGLMLRTNKQVQRALVVLGRVLFELELLSPVFNSGYFNAYISGNVERSCSNCTVVELRR